MRCWRRVRISTLRLWRPGTIGNFIIQDNTQVILRHRQWSLCRQDALFPIGTVTQTGGTINSRSAGVFQLAEQPRAWYLAAKRGHQLRGRLGIHRDAAPVTRTSDWPAGCFRRFLSPVSPGNGLIVGEQGTGTLTISNEGSSSPRRTRLVLVWRLVGIRAWAPLDLDAGGTLVANYVQNGTGSGTFNFNGGVLRAGPAAGLNFMGGLTAANVLAGATIDTGGKTIDIAQALLDGGMGGGLTKTGTRHALARWRQYLLWHDDRQRRRPGRHRHTRRPARRAIRRMLAIGPSIGTLTVNNTVNLAAGSTTVMKVNKESAANDQVLGVTSMTYGGTLVLTNLAGNLATNDSFRLFVAGSYHGGFTNVMSETPGQIVTWDVKSTRRQWHGESGDNGPSQVTITPVVSGTNLTLSWPAGQTGANLQEQINPLTVGLSTNWVTVPGSSTTNQITFPIVPTNGTVFSGWSFDQIW